MKAKILYMALAFMLVFSLAAVVVPAGPAMAYPGNSTINSGWTYSAPTIDGTLTAGEWDDAVTVAVGSATVYVMNDGTNLYMAAQVPDATNDLPGGNPWGLGGDYFAIAFDVGDDGLLTQNDPDCMDILVGIGGPPNSADYVDGYYDPAGCTWMFPAVRFSPDTSTKDGQGDWFWDGVNYYHEFSKSLNSGDALDMSVSPGDTIGMAMEYYDWGGFALPAPGMSYWPTTCNLLDAATWGDLVLAIPPLPTDYVDIGTPSSEAGHNLQGWGPIEPDTSGGSWGQLASGGYPDYSSVDNKCRCTVNKSSECDSPDLFWASFDLNTGTGMKATYLLLRVLDGQVNDSFQVYVNSILEWTYSASGGTETWVYHPIDISDRNLSGSITVTINCTEIASSWCTGWGQLGVDRAELYAEPTGDGGGGYACFIATAAYGTSSAEEIDVLRSFRDELMLGSAVGSQLVDWYYQTSPPVADFISGNSLLRTVVREMVIDPMVSVATFTQGIWGK